MALISSFKVKRGPLVKSWGDSTPATKHDVTVYVNDEIVEVEDLNPYTGEIFLVEPIEAQDPGDITVEVDYHWLASPVFPLSGLNVEGLSLNTFTPSKLAPQSLSFALGGAGNIGAMDTSVFPYGVVLGPWEAQKPIHIGHRFIGFDFAYTSSLNNPLSLVLNQEAHRLEVSKDPFSFSYDAKESPNDSERAWILLGQDTGSTQGGVHNQKYEGQSLYYRTATFDSQDFVYFSTRVKVESYTLNGISTGIVFGFKNNRDLYVGHLLEINGVKHFGILKDNDLYLNKQGYSIGPFIDASITSNTQCLLSQNLVNFDIGSRFSILSGNQSGIYTIKSKEGLLITIEETFPANFRLYGNKEIRIYPELDWSTPTSFRIYSDKEGSYAYISGSVSGSFLLDTNSNIALDNLPQDSSFFWGGLDNHVSGSTLWSFVKYGVTPRFFYETHSDIQVNSLAQWDQSGFGYYKEDTSYQGVSYISKREEPFLKPENLFRLEGSYSALFQTSPSILDIQNSQRQIVLGALTYIEDAGTPYRRLFSMPSVSSFDTDLDWKDHINFNRIVLGGDNYGDLTYTLEDLDPLDEGNRFFEIGFVCDTNDLYWQAKLSVQGKSIGFVFGAGSLSIITEYTTLETYGDLDITSKHVLRLVVNSESESVILKLDGEALTPLINYGDLENTTQTDNTCIVSFDGQDASFDIYWSSFGAFASSSCKRTFGILTNRGNGSSLDHWEIPRTDSSSNDNSKEVGPVIQEMDWSSTCDFYLQVDPSWGLTFFRPDLSLPPYYEGEDGRGTGFATEYLIPSAGWINVEAKDLPRSIESSIRYGILEGYAEQTWEDISYTINSSNYLEDHIPSPMVLNQANVITSGENLQDNIPEIYSIEVLSNRTLSLIPLHVYAKTIYKVIDGDTVYTQDMFVFDKHTQTLTLGQDADGFDYVFTNSNVEVVFESDRPTTTYLQESDFWDSVTKLNEGTPSFEKSKAFNYETTYKVGSVVYPISDTVDDPNTVLSSPDINLNHSFEGLFEDLEFFEVDNGGSRGLISWPLEATSLDSAKNEWDLEGGDVVYSNEGEEVGFTGAPQGGHVLSLSNYRETLRGDLLGESLGLPFLFASGGSFFGPVIEDGNVVSLDNPLGGLLNEVQLNHSAEVFVLEYSSSDNPLEENGVLNVSEESPDIQLV
jgi:hypothetical protein